MIHTTYRGELLVAYDRKSPRHNWNIIVSDYPDNLARVQRIAQNWKDNAAWANVRYGGWDNYQQALVVLLVEEDGIIPDNLPKNVQFPRHDSKLGVYYGIVYP